MPIAASLPTLNNPSATCSIACGGAGTAGSARRCRLWVEEASPCRAILLRELGMPISRIVQTIATADKEIWRRLAIASRPHLVLEATAYAAEGKVVYFQEFYIPPNRRRLLFDSELRN